MLFFCLRLWMRPPQINWLVWPAIAQERYVQIYSEKMNFAMFWTINMNCVIPKQPLSEMNKAQECLETQTTAMNQNYQHNSIWNITKRRFCVLLIQSYSPAPAL